ncbi:VWA domain-containing protein [Halorubrum ezzemoulense]|uniref:VWA domain-containing protein n=1 Tax=Halorubrum ezzemoulense TaxID=337243 RepID=UPI00232C2DF2|nr:VWA domain-containing protein [Halorubrum ezzemoulense]MDB2275778.1 VWA domain-containing protein [Halorubrum ezzemoulense]
MTDDNNPKLYDLSRRRVLAGLGAVGIASAGAGVGTSAFFSDQEDFEGNELTAGTLDVLVDWEEHYYDGSAGRDLVELVPESEIDILDDNQYILPAVENPDARAVAVRFLGDGTFQENKDAFWDATSIEALPDGNDDGIQDEFDDSQVCNGEAGLTDVGNAPPDPVPANFSEGLYSPNRTSNEVTAPGDPLINLGDVKPGDFGEVTFSFHLCDNPGYVWMNGELVDWSEGNPMYTEPELSDPDEDGSETPTVDDIELLDEMQVRMWYDPDCDNQVERRGEVDIMLAIDTSGSITGQEQTNLENGIAAFVDALPTDGSAQVGAVSFGGDSVTGVSGLVDPGSFSLGSLSYGGNTPLPAGLDIADQVLDTQGRPDALPVVVVISDGGPNYDGDTSETYTASVGGSSYTAPRSDPGFSADDNTAGYDSGTTNSAVDAAEQDETAAVADLIKAGPDGSRIAVLNIGDDPNADLGDGTDLSVYLEDEIASAGFYNEIPLSNFVGVADDIAAEAVVEEEVFFNGSLRAALTALSDNEGRGVPLDGDRATTFDELADPEDDPNRDPFTGEGVTHCVGFQWWLPVNHANQIQGDMVGFDIGFYAEQSRHNTGVGMIPEDGNTTGTGNNTGV